jgi:uncharacterized protein YbjQ (UPF0145 family)
MRAFSRVARAFSTAASKPPAGNGYIPFPLTTTRDSFIGRTTNAELGICVGTAAGGTNFLIDMYARLKGLAGGSLPYADLLLDTVEQAKFQMLCHARDQGANGVVIIIIIIIFFFFTRSQN